VFAQACAVLFAFFELNEGNRDFSTVAENETLPNDFINVAFVVCRSTMLAIQYFHLKQSPLISCEDSLPNLLAKNVCCEIFLSVDGIPGERQTWLRRIAFRSPWCL
jgi:hypothetical protein